MSDDILTAEEREVVNGAPLYFDARIYGLLAIIDRLEKRVRAGELAVETLTRGLAECEVRALSRIPGANWAATYNRLSNPIYEPPAADLDTVIHPAGITKRMAREAAREAGEAAFGPTEYEPIDPAAVREAVHSVRGIPKWVKTEVYRCRYCGTEAIHIGNADGSSDTQCPKGCPGHFYFVKEYPLATGIDGIREAFEEAPYDE